MGAHFIHVLFLIVVLMTLGCSRELSECNGWEVDEQKLQSIRETYFSQGPDAALIVPNPLDAGNVSNLQSSSLLESISANFSLPDLINPNRLETDFLKIRLHDISDDTSILAKPTSPGIYDYTIKDPHYSEVMAYHSLSAMIRYVESMGFSLVKSRPLYVMVKAENPDSNSSNTVNAVYTHHYFDPSEPRTLHLFGETDYAPGMDRDIYWHEFGHFLNESLSRESGMDYAGDSGAIFTEGGALHECLADYLSESVGNKGYIGRWIAKNFPQIPAGQPLRSAENRNDEFSTYKNISNFNSDGRNLDRYRMAQWCSRVLWDIRSKFVKQNPETGAIFADRLMFSAVSLLKRDTSISQFKSALQVADQNLHCGLHSNSIAKAFETRGFTENSPQLSTPLLIKGTPKKDNSEVTFSIFISNPTSVTARNVRVVLEPLDGKISPSLYMQGYGDLPPGGVIQIGTPSGLGSEYSVFGKIMASGTAKYRLRVRIENGPDGVQEGQIGL